MSNGFTRFLIFTLLISPFVGFPQREFNNWYFGNKAGVSFNIGYPVVFLSSSLLCFTTGSSNISDSLGNILFYTNGREVYNRNNDIMPDGWINGLCGSMDYDKVNIAFQQLADPTKYFLFTACNGGIPPYYLRYSVIDMNLDSGLGDIPAWLNGVIIPGTDKVYNTVTATRHHNNHDVWVVVRNMDQDSNYFASYLVNSSGINFTPVFSNSLVPFIGSGPPRAIYNIKISRDGMKMAAVYTDTLLEFCQFNTSNGQVTPLFLVTLPVYNGNHIALLNAEFSIDSKYLYVSGRAGGANVTSRFFIYQFDATLQDSAQFLNSETVIINENRGHGIQMAPDGKIYCSILYYISSSSAYFVDSLSVINSPSVHGTGCNYQANVLSLLGRQSGYSLPDYVERYYAMIYDSAQCQDSSVNFSSAIWPHADSIHWDFGDPPSGPANYSSLPNPSHTYPAVSGTYTVTLFVRHIDKRTDTTWKVINILQKPDVGPDQTTCAGDSVTFDAGACTGCTYVWKDLASGLTVDTTRLFKTDQPGNYAAIVTYSNGCIGSDTVQLFTTPVPTVTNNPLSKSICSGESTNIALTSNVPGTTFHWTCSLTLGNVSGFGADSGLVINQVLINTLSTPGVVTYHITPVIGNCAGSTVDFTVTVNPGDSVSISISTPTDSVCEGTQVTYTATPVNGGTSPFFQWKVNGIDVGPNNPTYSYIPVNGDVVTCILTSSNSVCISNNPATSNQLYMVILSNTVVAVSITASANPECAGLPVTFTATPTNGGSSSSSYQWKVNGLNVGTDSPNYTYNPLNGDVVTCVLSSSEICTINNPATSNQVIMVIMDILDVSVSISASANPFCQGSSVAFTATPVNGGMTPSYQWKVNGINAGANSPTFTYNPVSGDQVSCILTSSIQCPISNPVTSNTILMIMNNNLPASVFISASANPFCPGNSITFIATPTNGGTNPSYQWKVNGINAGTNSPTFTYNPVSGDQVSCLMTSNLACVTNNPATSNIITMDGGLAPFVTFTRCFDSITTTNAKPFKLKGGIPLGGTYSGPGVSAGILTPSIAGAGTKTITYTYTNAALCSASASIQFVIRNPSFVICGSDLTDIRDNKTYPTVKIGSQCWMASNLNYGYANDEFTNQRDNCIPEKYCYQNNPVNCTNQGALYQWDEIMQYDETVSNQGLCPPAWHLPSESDWNILFSNYTNNAFAAWPLLYTGFSGFNGLLSGNVHMNKTIDWVGFVTFFWSSTPAGTLKTWAHGMNSIDPSVSLYPALRSNAFSVRCIKD